MKKAFSMIEMIFAIAVIGILSAIAIPKMMANRETAQLVKLKEQIEAIRKGIEAYAGNQYIETGIKKYPNSLCDPNSNCNTSSHLFRFLTNIDIPHRDIVRNGRNFVFWGAGKEIMIMEDYKIKKGYAFSYNSSNGEFKCINKNSDGYSSLPCKDLGE